MLKRQFSVVMIFLLLMLIGSPLLKVQAAIFYPVTETISWDHNIISPSDVTLEQAKQWAKSKGATQTFIGLADLYFKYSNECGQVNPAIAYVQSAKETNFGKFTGVINETFKNPCGLKISSGGGNDDPNAHKRFSSWDEGVKAHLDHLALYAGAVGYPKANTSDPRHFSKIKGKALTVKALGGNWAPSLTYGDEVNRYYNELINYYLKFEVKI